MESAFTWVTKLVLDLWVKEYFYLNDFLFILEQCFVHPFLSRSLVGEAVSSASYIRNRVSNKMSDKNSYELWKWFPPNLKFLKAWVVRVGLST